MFPVTSQVHVVSVLFRRFLTVAGAGSCVPVIQIHVASLNVAVSQHGVAVQDLVPVTSGTCCIVRVAVS
jgi:hypothetical protein